MESSAANLHTDTLAALERFYGFRGFVTDQETVIQSILAGKDTLVVMPTGGGKSLCYQLPALMREGVTVVVSPLIALMKDQVDALLQRGIPATMVNSTIGGAEQLERLRGIERGDYKLVYIAPERFRSRSFTAALGRARLAFVAIDEAHCLSQWGHDFRPDYLRIKQALRDLGRPQVTAFTATATKEVRDDVLAHLEMREPSLFVTGFSRPNLRLMVTHVDSEADKLDRVLDLARTRHTGIVYCASRKRVEEVALALQGNGLSCVAYHGGMEDAAREEAQNMFLNRSKNIAVATNAFGMGIDRADIRFVAHYEVPGSIEAYYQEAGRAGRDGEPSVCELLFNFADTRIQEFFIEGNNPGRQLILDTYELLRSRADTTGRLTLPVNEMVEGLGPGTNPMGVSTALSILVRHGFIERYDVPGQRVRGTRVTDPSKSGNSLTIDMDALSEKERRDRAKLRGIIDFCYARRCRQEWILDYFGEENPDRCGNCDCCESGHAEDHRTGTEEEMVIVKKALSGVARMSRRHNGVWEPRFGRGRIIQMLVGSRSREILQARLDELSTYGLLKNEGTAFLNELFRSFLQEGWIVVSEGDYPMVTLTGKGTEVMLGKRECRLRWPERRGGRSGKASGKGGGEAGMDWPLRPEDEPLYQELKEIRLEMAQKANAPAYTIFPNLTLRALATAKPIDEEEAMNLPGIGAQRAKRHLPPFLEAIRSRSE